VVFEWIIDWIKDRLGDIWAALSGIYDRIRSWVADKFSFVFRWIEEKLSGIKRWFSSALEELRSWVLAGFAKWKEYFDVRFSRLWDRDIDLRRHIVENRKWMLSKISDAFSGLFARLEAWILTKILEWIAAKLDEVIETMEEAEEYGKAG